MQLYKKYQLPTCEYIANGLKCTDMCKLLECGNQSPVTIDDGSEDKNAINEDEDEEEFEDY